MRRGLERLLRGWALAFPVSRGFRPCFAREGGVLFAFGLNDEGGCFLSPGSVRLKGNLALLGVLALWRLNSLFALQCFPLVDRKSVV